MCDIQAGFSTSIYRRVGSWMPSDDSYHEAAECGLNSEAIFTSRLYTSLSLKSTNCLYSMRQSLNPTTRWWISEANGSKPRHVDIYRHPLRPSTRDHWEEGWTRVAICFVKPEQYSFLVSRLFRFFSETATDVQEFRDMISWVWEGKRRWKDWSGSSLLHHLVV